MMQGPGFDSPKDHGARFTSTDRAETMDIVGRLLAPHAMDVRSPGVSTRLDYARIACGTVVDLSYGADVVITSSAPSDHYLIHCLAEGNSSIERSACAEPLLPQTVQITRPGEAFAVHFGARSRHLTVSIQRSALERAIGRHLGKKDAHPLILAHGSSLGAPWGEAWLHLLRFITSWSPTAAAAHYTATGTRPLSELLIGFIADKCTQTASPDAASDHGVVPWYVRRACAIVEADLRHPGDELSVAGVATALGISVRTLQSGFSRHLRTTFRNHVRDRRLDMLDHRLREDDAGADVTSIMQSCGINGFSRYASYYRRRFGRAPSDTLRSRSYPR